MVGNYFVPKGHLVNCLVYSIHHDPKIYNDPESFRPERFSEEESKGRPSYAYLPFGIGARTCIGNKFAMLEQAVILVELLRKYRVELIDPNYEIKIAYSFTCTPSSDFCV